MDKQKTLTDILSNYIPQKNESFLEKILSANEIQPRLSLSGQLEEMMRQSEKPNIEQKEGETENHKGTLTGKNFSSLVDKTDEHESKIKMIRDKLRAMECAQKQVQADISKSNDRLEKLEILRKEGANKIDWKSFAYGAIALAGFLLYINYRT